MSDIDFKEQIEQEEKAKQKEERQQTYTDEDGTVFEWDIEKKAWFPKIDEDFIANYQMNYGINNIAETSEDTKSTAEATNPDDAEAVKKYEKYCKDYYNYYGCHYQPEAEGGEQSTEDTTTPYSNINPETGQEFKDHAEYYAYYYGQEYADYYKNFEPDDVSVPGSNQPQKNPSKKELKKLKAGEKRKLAPTKEEPKWFEHETQESTQVYVTGLPTDITEEEFLELMTKYGLIMFDPFTKKPKAKLYKDKDGNIKGDGLCCYIKKESVDLCLKLLDGLDVRGTGSKVTVEKAKFEMKGNFDPAKKKKLTNKQKRKMKENQAKLFDWKLEKPTDVRLKHEKVVVLKNMFDVKEFETDVTLINELREDVRTECVKFGDVRKVMLHDRHPEGVMTVMFKTAEEADASIEALNGRWFAKKQIIAETWDGKTKYEVEETEEQKAERLKAWDQFLVDEAAKKEPSTMESKSAEDSVDDSSSVTLTNETPVIDKDNAATSTSSESFPSNIHNKDTSNTMDTSETPSEEKDDQSEEIVNNITPSEETEDKSEEMEDKSEEREHTVDD